jgi:hypothetical protein
MAELDEQTRKALIETLEQSQALWLRLVGEDAVVRAVTFAQLSEMQAIFGQILRLIAVLKGEGERCRSDAR